MKNLSTHITESFQINESRKTIKDPLIVDKTLSMLDAQEQGKLVKKDTIESYMLSAAYYAASSKEHGYGNGYDQGMSDNYLEKANKILDDEAFHKNQTIRRRLTYEYVQSMFGKEGQVKGLTYDTDTVQKYEIHFYNGNTSTVLEITFDSGKDSNAWIISGYKENRYSDERQPQMKHINVDTFAQAKKKFEAYLKK